MIGVVDMNKIKIIILMILISLSMSGCNLSGSYSKSIKKISGSSSSWTGDKKTEIEFEKGETVTFSYQSKLKSGELDIQLFNPSDEVIHEFEVNKEGEKEIEIMESGTYIIKFTGTEFKGNYKVEW